MLTIALAVLVGIVAGVIWHSWFVRQVGGAAKQVQATVSAEGQKLAADIKSKL